MAKLSFYLDERKGKPKIKLVIHACNKVVQLSTGVTLDYREQWTGEMSSLVVGHPLASAWNKMLTSRFALALDAMYKITDRKDYTIEDVKKAVIEAIDPSVEHDVKPADLLLPIWRKFMEGKGGRTFELYHETLGRICAFVGGDDKLQKLRIEDITLDWLDGFDRWMSSTRGVNSRAIDMRNLRAVCMYAWKYDYTEKYVFKRWTIKKEEGNVRPITAEQFARLFSFDLTNRPDLLLYRDMALLGFLLIGCNMVDLHALTHDDLRDGYLYYRRAKTHRKYCIKVEPEAQAIIDKYKGEKHLLAWADRYKDHRDFVKHLNDALQKIGPSHVETIAGSYHGRTRVVYEPIIQDMTYYRLRHTFGVFAANDLDIPKDIVALCLGHGKKTVTDVYVQYDQRKIDKANRQVIDYAMELIKAPR